MKTFFEYLVRDLKYWNNEVSSHETNGTNKGSTSEVLTCVIQIKSSRVYRKKT